MAHVCRCSAPEAQGPDKNLEDKTYYVTVPPASENVPSDEEEYTMFPVFSSNCPSEPYDVDVCLNGLQVCMDLDTGAVLTVTNQLTYERLLKGEWTLWPFYFLYNEKWMSLLNHVIPNFYSLKWCCTT